MSTTPPAILIQDLRMRYGTTDVLTGVDLAVRAGEVLALLGPNGAGKTTTIEVLEGFRRPSSGRVEVLGADPTVADQAWRARVGIVLQSWRDHSKWKVRELLEYQGSYYRNYSTSYVSRPWPVADLLDAVGLTARAEAQIGQLSGGQRRRLDVAIGIVGRPELLLLDEPTTGFDPQARHDFHQVIKSVRDRFNTTVLLTTHDLTEAEILSDRVAILANGSIIATGTAAQLANQIAGPDEVRWSMKGDIFVRQVPDATEFVRRLFAQHGEAIKDLEVRRASLQETYLALVRKDETHLAHVANGEVTA